MQLRLLTADWRPDPFCNHTRIQHRGSLDDTGYELHAEQCGFRILVGTRDFSLLQNDHTRSVDHRAASSVDTGVLSRGQCSRGVKSTTHIHAVLRSRMSGAIPYCRTGKSLLFLRKYISTLLILLPFSRAVQCARKSYDIRLCAP